MPLPVEPVVGTAQDAADAALAFIESEIPGIEALSVMLNQRARPDGTIYDVMDVGWRIYPYSDVYYSHPNADKNWQNFVIGEIILKADKVLSIYQGLPARADIVQLPADWVAIHGG